MNIKKNIFTLLFLATTFAHADLLTSLGLKNDTALEVVIGESSKTIKDIEQLKKDIATAESETKLFEEELQAKIDKARSRVEKIEFDIKRDVSDDDTYLNKQLFVAKSMVQVLTTMRTVRKNWIDELKSRLALLEAIEEERRRANEDKKSLYTFDELRLLNQNIASQEDKASHAETEKNEIKLDLDNSKKKLDAAEKYLKEKQKERGDFNKDIQIDDYFITQKSVLLDLEIKLAEYERALALLRVKERSANLTYLETTEEVEVKKLAQLRQKKELVVRASLRVDQVDINRIQDVLKQEKRKYLNETDKRLQAIENLSNQEEKYKKDLFELEEKFPDREGDIVNLLEWSASPTTVEGFIALGERGSKNDQINFIKSQIDFERAHIQLAKSLFKEYELAAQTVESWYKIKHQLFKSGQELNKEIIAYQDLSGELSRERSIYEDKRHTATNRLNIQNKALSNIRTHINELNNKKKILFKAEEEKFIRAMNAFQKAFSTISKQIEITSKLIEVYSRILVSLGGSIKENNNMVIELQRVSLWHRSGGAISREGLNNIGPDLEAFATDVRILGSVYFSGLTLRSFVRKIIGVDRNFLTIILLLWKFSLLFFLFLFIKRYLPALSAFFMAVGTEYRGAFLFSRIAALFIDFIRRHFVSLYFWILFLFGIGINPHAELFPSIIFFLFSTPYLLYLSYSFISFVRKFNEDHVYELYPQNFTFRFRIIGSIFLYTTSFLLSFREAFLLVSYAKSELPSVFLALYSIIVRILLLALIRREDLLSIIPSRTAFGSFCWRIVDQYYYILLFLVIFVMILSDPHIGGYDNLVSYFFWGLFGTLLVGRLLFSLHGFCRRISSYIFFASDGETLNERFKNSKTWYGFAVVILFLVFFILGIWVIAWFWGKAIPFDTIGSFFQEKRLAIGFTNGQYQKVSIFDIVRTVLFIPSAFLIAHLVERFILDWIFSVLLVDPGVHNAISTITYYLVIISVVTLGLIQEGFGFLVVYYLLPLLVGMGFALREIFNDFVAYFVLLIQRPLKIGDYIELSDEVKGVVRKITPRAVILRRKRSYHIVVPNAKLIQQTISNWDYARGFITFPDIIVGIRYAADPDLTRKVLIQAVDSISNVLKTPPPIVRLDEFGPSGYVFMVRGYISSELTLLQWDIASDVRFAIVKLLHQNGIEISFPVRVIRMMGESKEHQYLDPSISTPPTSNGNVDYSNNTERSGNENYDQ